MESKSVSFHKKMNLDELAQTVSLFWYLRVEYLNPRDYSEILGKLHEFMIDKVNLDDKITSFHIWWTIDVA